MSSLRFHRALPNSADNDKEHIADTVQCKQLQGEYSGIQAVQTITRNKQCTPSIADNCKEHRGHPAVQTITRNKQWTASRQLQRTYSGHRELQTIKRNLQWTPSSEENSQEHIVDTKWYRELKGKYSGHRAVQTITRKIH